MMYEEIGLEPIDPAASEESIPRASPFDGSWKTAHAKPFKENNLDLRLIRIIKALDR